MKGKEKSYPFQTIKEKAGGGKEFCVSKLITGAAKTSTRSLQGARDGGGDAAVVDEKSDDYFAAAAAAVAGLELRTASPAPPRRSKRLKESVPPSPPRRPCGRGRSRGESLCLLASFRRSARGREEKKRCHSLRPAAAAAASSPRRRSRARRSPRRRCCRCCRRCCSRSRKTRNTRC